jgi:glutathione S-transferase
VAPLQFVTGELWCSQDSPDTPNGFKASILLEELKDAYGLEYSWQSVNINKDTQKEPWFTALCPNGRIPCIVDHERGGMPVFEGIAILGYLTRHYDPDNKFSFDVNDDQYTIAEEWMAWQHGGVGPMWVCYLTFWLESVVVIDVERTLRRFLAGKARPTTSSAMPRRRSRTASSAT